MIQINMEKYVAFLYANNDQSEEEIKETITFTIASKSIKYSEINLTNKVRDMQYENYKDTEEINGQKYQYKWKDMLCSWFRRFNIGKVSLLPTVINGFDAIPIEILMVSISELELIVTFIWNHTQKKN